MKFSYTLVAAYILAAPLAWAHSKHEPKAPPPGFDSLKSLVGTWEGTTKVDGKDVPMTTVFESTSGGTVITEKMGPGTDHEMINVYHAEGGRLAMTHYCALGNQPHMMMKKGDGKTLAFEMEKPIGVSSMSEPHMHAVTLTMTDKDTLTQEWTNMTDGKTHEKAVFKYKRKK